MPRGSRVHSSAGQISATRSLGHPAARRAPHVIAHPVDQPSQLRGSGGQAVADSVSTGLHLTLPSSHHEIYLGVVSN